MSKFNKPVRKPCLNRSSSHTFKHWEVIKTNIKVDCDDHLKNSVALVLKDEPEAKNDNDIIVEEHISDDVDYKDLFIVENCFSVNNPSLEKNIIVEEYTNKKEDEIIEDEIIEDYIMEEKKDIIVEKKAIIEEKIKLITKPKSLIDVVMALQREALREKLNREAFKNNI